MEKCTSAGDVHLTALCNKKMYTKGCSCTVHSNRVYASKRKAQGYTSQLVQYTRLRTITRVHSWSSQNTTLRDSRAQFEYYLIVYTKNPYTKHIPCMSVQSIMLNYKMPQAVYRGLPYTAPVITSVLLPNTHYLLKHFSVHYHIALAALDPCTCSGL